MRNKEQREGKCKDGHAAIITCVKMQGGVRHVMIVACPSLAFAFTLLLISHACIYCVFFLYFLALSSLHPILMKCFHTLLNCSSTGILIIGSRGLTDIMEAKALSHHYNTIDIYSNSWGLEDDGTILQRPLPCTEKTLKLVAEKVYYM